TGNKSEMSVGYATLYGDMCGGYSVLKDVYKTTIFALCRWRNQALPHGSRGPAGRVMPERVITKAPTAELKPDQRDEDHLPRYAPRRPPRGGWGRRESRSDVVAARAPPRAGGGVVAAAPPRAKKPPPPAPGGGKPPPPRLGPEPPLPHHQRLPRRLRHGGPG